LKAIVIYWIGSYVAGMEEALSDWPFSDGKPEIMKRWNGDSTNVSRSSFALAELIIR
jgi:hypothetical protein